MQEYWKNFFSELDFFTTGDLTEINHIYTYTHPTQHTMQRSKYSTWTVVGCFRMWNTYDKERTHPFLSIIYKNIYFILKYGWLTVLIIYFKYSCVYVEGILLSSYQILRWSNA